MQNCAHQRRIDAIESLETKYVTLHGKGDFADVIKVLRWEIVLHCLGGPNAITKILLRRTQEGQSQREEVGMEADVREAKRCCYWL